MNATHPRLESDTALCAMTEDGAVVIAALADSIPPTVDVLPNGDPKLKWQAAVVSWPLARPSTGSHTAFIAVFPLPGRERANLRSVSILLPGRSLSLALRKPSGGLDSIFKTIADEAGSAFPSVVDGFVEALLGEGGGSGSGPRRRRHGPPYRPPDRIHRGVRRQSRG